MKENSLIKGLGVPLAADEWIRAGLNPINDHLERYVKLQETIQNQTRDTYRQVKKDPLNIGFRNIIKGLKASVRYQRATEELKAAIAAQKVWDSTFKCYSDKPQVTNGSHNPPPIMTDHFALKEANLALQKKTRARRIPTPSSKEKEPQKENQPSEDIPSSYPYAVVVFEELASQRTISTAVPELLHQEIEGILTSVLSGDRPMRVGQKIREVLQTEPEILLSRYRKPVIFGAFKGYRVVKAGRLGRVLFRISEKEEEGRVLSLRVAPYTQVYGDNGYKR